MKGSDTKKLQTEGETNSVKYLIHHSLTHSFIHPLIHSFIHIQHLLWPNDWLYGMKFHFLYKKTWTIIIIWLLIIYHIMISRLEQIRETESPRYKYDRPYVPTWTGDRRYANRRLLNHPIPEGTAWQFITYQQRECITHTHTQKLYVILKLYDIYIHTSHNRLKRERPGLN